MTPPKKARAKPKPLPTKAKVKASAKAKAKRLGLSLGAAKVEILKGELERVRADAVSRWNANPDDVQKSVAQLVLALVEFLRKLLERQAVRRMENDTLDHEEVERIGLALMRLEETVHEMAERFGLDPEELNLDLGPLGRLS